MFKPGDRVKLVRTQSMAAEYGAQATVVAPGHVCRDGRVLRSYGDKYVLVEWDDGPKRRSQMNGDYELENFESVESPW